MMFRHDQTAYLRDQIAAEDRLAQTAPTMEARRIHAELAIYYRAELRTLKARQHAYRVRQIADQAEQRPN